MSSPGFTIIAERPGFLVVDKEPGLDFHACGLAPGLCRLVAEAMGAPVWPVHRLDKETSGLLILATNKPTAAGLAELFRTGGMEKYYVALSDMPPRKKQGLIQGDMVRSRRGTWKLCRSLEKPARTRFFSRHVAPGLRLYVLRPLTGRTHQLRVALKSVSAPILGDRLYHPQVQNWPDRMYLHAHTLRFRLNDTTHVFACPPRTGEYFRRDDVTATLAGLGRLEEMSGPDGQD